MKLRYSGAGRLVFFIGVLGFGLSCRGKAPLLRADIDWPSFIGRHDLIWERMPEIWYDAPFLGNGEMGTLVRKTGPGQVRWDIGNSLVHDHREPDDYSVRSPGILNRGRLPIGHFVLETEGTITGGAIRLDLWNAEASGTIVTEKGEVGWRTLVHAEDMILFVELTAMGGEREPDFRFVPEKAESYRFTRNRDSLPAEFLKNYPPNPDPVLSTLPGGFDVCEQGLVAGGQTSTAWFARREGRSKKFFITCRHSYPEPEATMAAEAELRKAGRAGVSAWVERHRLWWHSYYGRSFVGLSDPVWESFYWIQMYKLACATRAGRALIDNQGPWLQPTGWNGTWWNLNVQLSYSPVPASNRLDLAGSLTERLRANLPNLIANVDEPYRSDSAGLSRNTSMLDLKGKSGKPGGWEHPNPDIGSETGNLTWICHNLYTLYRGSLDESLLADVLYPLLKRAVNYYRHFLSPGPDGRWHLPATHSPEYGNAPDANFDLSLIRWGCRTLIELSGKLGLDRDMIPVWTEIQEKLVEFPANENGFMVGAGVGFDKSHRHWSHLLMVYPLRLVTPESGGEEIIRKSLARWHSFPSGLVGYSFTGGASIAALLRDGNKALEYLNGLLPYLGSSTMYYEGGKEALPVMETPLHAACAVQEMLLQSWGGRIRVFPAVPEAWAEACFHDLRAEGAFLVSASRRDGKTRWIRLKSLKGEPCLLETDLEEPEIRGLGGTRIEPVDGEKGLYRLDLKEGQEVILVSAAGDEAPVVTPASRPKSAPSFGLK
jgi:hypothetical protein